MPRNRSQASNGPSTAPARNRISLIRAQNASSRAGTRAPARTSWWPFRYLVAECMTMSAPSSIGRVSTGVATVLSTTSRAPAACASSAAAAMSVTAQVGLAGVSTQTSRVAPGRSAAAMASTSPVVTKLTSRPQWAACSFSHLGRPKYITSGTTTWSPGRSDWNTAVAAATPEANSAAAGPPSSAAIKASAWS